MPAGEHGDAPEVGDEDFLTMVQDDRARARMLRKQVQALAGGGAGEVLQEMSQEILSGRVGIREALRVPAYAEALEEQARSFREGWERMSPEEREEHRAAAERYLEEQREEIDEEYRQGGT